MLTYDGMNTNMAEKVVQKELKQCHNTTALAQGWRGDSADTDSRWDEWSASRPCRALPPRKGPPGLIR
jgi:hypothetical protein